jgi:hypothetical protein
MLRLQTYTASDPGFTVNSHLIMGEKEAILVDVQFLRNEAKKVYSEIPPTIEYSITNKAKELESIMSTLDRWWVCVRWNIEGEKNGKNNCI